MSHDDYSFRYWKYALQTIKEVNPELFGTVKPVNRNALNGKQKAGIEFVCLANRRKSNIPAKSIAVEMYIDGSNEDRERIKQQFHFLKGKEAEIEQKIPGLQWNENPRDRASSIIAYAEIDYTDENNWERCAEFHSIMMKRLHDYVFLPYAEELFEIIGRTERKAGAGDADSLMQPKMMLSSIIMKYGLKPENVKLVRHPLNNNEARTCLNMGFIEAYQSIQTEPVFHGFSHVLVFMGERKGTTAVFLGLYKVNGEYSNGPFTSRMPEGYPFPAEYIEDKYWYDLERLPLMDGLKDELRIEWGRTLARIWHQIATHDKVIIGIPKDFPTDQTELSEDNPITEEPKFIEDGTGKQVLVKRYERNPAARWDCLKANGYRCKVCGFDSEEQYGRDFKNIIEVHHIIPISERNESYEINPKEDLIPVCPNCHTMLHSKMPDGRLLVWQELRERYQKKKD